MSSTGPVERRRLEESRNRRGEGPKGRKQVVQDIGRFLRNHRNENKMKRKNMEKRKDGRSQQQQLREEKVEQEVGRVTLLASSGS